MTASGGLETGPRGGGGNLMPNDGVLIAVKRGPETRVMPFLTGNIVLPAGVSLVKKEEVTRRLGAATDEWTLPLGVKWTHYSPAWAMPNWDTATLAEKRRFTLPATWMQYTLDNRQGKSEMQMLFSLQQPAARATGWHGFDGYTVGADQAVAMKTGNADLLTEAQAQADFGLAGATAAFRVRIAPGAQKSVTFTIAHLRLGQISQLKDIPLTETATALYPEIDAVLQAAAAEFPNAVIRSKELNAQVDRAPISDERNSCPPTLCTPICSTHCFSPRPTEPRCGWWKKANTPFSTRLTSQLTRCSMNWRCTPGLCGMNWIIFSSITLPKMR